MVLEPFASRDPPMTPLAKISPQRNSQGSKTPKKRFHDFSRKPILRYGATDSLHETVMDLLQDYDEFAAEL